MHQIAPDGLSVVFRTVAPSQAAVQFVLRSGATNRIWDSDIAAQAMRQLLAVGRCTVIEARFETGTGPAPVGLGIILEPQELSGEAQQVLGVSRITTPRIILVVSPGARGEGIGRALLSRVLESAQEQGLQEVEVEAERGHTAFFEDHFNFTRRVGVARDYYLGKGRPRLYMLDKRLR